MTLKIEWQEFVDAAMSQLRESHPSLAEPKFKKRYGYESDGDAYDIPDYVEIELRASPVASVSAPESPEQFYERGGWLGTLPGDSVEDFARCFAFAREYSSSSSAAPERKLWIESINAELAQLREWANTESKRAEAAEGKCAELESQVKQFGKVLVAGHAILDSAGIPDKNIRPVNPECDSMLVERLALLRDSRDRLQEELSVMTKNRDDCANVFKIDRAHEMSGPAPECACPSCSLHHKFKAERDRLQEALREIAEPVPFMRKRAEAQGGKLNGHMAVILSDDANFLKAIAREALKDIGV